MNNGTPHLKPSKNQNRRAALRRPAIKLLEALTSLRPPTLALDSALVHQTKQLQQKHHTTKQEQTTKLNQNTQHLFYLFSVFYNNKPRQRAKGAAMQVATMLADNKQIDKRTTMRNQNRSAALGRLAMKLLGASTSLRSTNPRPYFCLGSSDT